MCGIVGMVGNGATAGAGDLELTTAMTRALTHRGPDAQGIQLGDGYALGHRRLSIIDLDGGAQPMSHDDGGLWLVYNGEIYNHVSLREQLEAKGQRFRTRSDTEVLLAAYRVWGEQLVDHLNGMFAFGLWDSNERSLLLARDRVGIKPLYYAQVTRSDGSGHALVFASEPKAILLHPDVDRALDPTALDAYLDLFYVPPPLSIFAGVRQLPPGHLLRWHDGQTSIRSYWDAQPAVSQAHSLETWAEIAAPVVEDAIRMRTLSDVPLGAFLSGGLDSSTIVAVLAEHSSVPVETFCVGYGEEGRSFDERAMARVVADHFGTNHHELEIDIDVLAGLEGVVRGFDEPFGSPTALLSSALSKFTREFVTVALAGDGGDELFGGYPRYRGLMFSEKMAGLPSSGVRALKRVVRGREASVARSYRRWGRQFLQGLSRPPPQRYAAWVGYARPEERDRLLTAPMREQIDARGRIDPVVDAFTTPRDADAVERAAYADLHGFLPENVLRCSDRMSMAHGLELRVPLCDHRLVEIAMQVPSRHRLGALVSKRLLRKIAGPRLPSAVLRRRKLGFNGPLGAWMRRDLERIVGHWFDPDQVARRGLFEPSVIDRLVSEHREGARDHSMRLWSLMVIEQWQRLYLD